METKPKKWYERLGIDRARLTSKHARARNHKRGHRRALRRARKRQRLARKAHRRG